MQWQGEILQNKEVAKDTYFMVLHAPPIVERARPGQFVNVLIGNDSGLLLRRPFGFHFLDGEQGAFGLLYAVVGQGTVHMAQLPQGGCLDVLGPLGNGFNCDFSGQRALVVAGGLGMASLLPLVIELRRQNKEVNVLIGVSDRQYLPDLGMYTRLGASCQVASDNGSVGRHGYVTALLEETVQAEPCDYIYGCGPKPMLREVERIAARYHIDGEVSTEERMGCGLGICLSCSVRTKDGANKKVCTDGPVFRMGALQYE